MNKASIVVRTLVGITGLVQLTLGILFWTGHARSLVPVHMAIGSLFVLSLWGLAALSRRQGAPLGLVWAAVVWGLLLAIVGMTQMRILVGPLHWIVQVGHLLMAMIAMAMGGRFQAYFRGPARGLAKTAPKVPNAA
jgi:hypothetical protein